MVRKKGYEIVIAGTAVQLAEKINIKIKIGGQPFGNPFTTPNHEMNSASYWCQAVVWDEDDSEKKLD